ncbi:unnamed protein product [Clonostachys rosea]|uniref:Uncharacterized protein n=1 Tax=Bionectria ochroleuca TaxID=29856 RepID=A0ABY6UZV4_BIOOC|nr:unnamed protein product [Clonostachys rosea]
MQLALGSLGSLVFALAVVGFFFGGRSVDTSFARKAGHAYFPASFSFGWFGYIPVALFRLLSSRTLMPKPAFPVRVIDLDNATASDNKSWIISHYLRSCMRDMNRQLGSRPNDFRIFVFMSEKRQRPSTYTVYMDDLFRVSFLIAQFIASLTLGFMRDDWGVLTITLYGTLLSCWIGRLSQWNTEKNPPLQESAHTFALTSKGDPHEVMIIKSSDEEKLVLNLDHLAQSYRPASSVVLSVHLFPYLISLFLLHMTLTVETNQTVLCIVGILGMADNFLSSWWTRYPEQWDMLVSLKQVIHSSNMMDALTVYETSYSHGAALRRDFFPYDKEPVEEGLWNGDTSEHDAAKERNGRDGGESMQ